MHWLHLVTAYTIPVHIHLPHSIIRIQYPYRYMYLYSSSQFITHAVLTIDIPFDTPIHFLYILKQYTNLSQYISIYIQTFHIPHIFISQTKPVLPYHLFFSFSCFFYTCISTHSQNTSFTYSQHTTNIYHPMQIHGPIITHKYIKHRCCSVQT